MVDYKNNNISNVPLQCFLNRIFFTIIIIIIIVDFAVSADHRIKLKECAKKEKYLNLAREMKKTVTKKK